MKKKLVMGSVVLFAGGCWGPVQPKNPADTTQPVDTMVDSWIQMDTQSPPPDTVGCYQSPDDPNSLLGRPCQWSNGAECGDEEEPVVLCENGIWIPYANTLDPQEGGCICAPATEACRPPEKVCFVAGFIGIHRQGLSRQPTRIRTLRLG
jgi:hypothetical protein